MSDDLITVVARLANGFRALNLPPPEAITLKSFDDGMRVLSELKSRPAPMMLYSPGEPGVRPIEGENGVTFMEVEVYGTKIRWPAKKFALPQGGWRFG